MNENTNIPLFASLVVQKLAADLPAKMQRLAKLAEQGK
jgi:hypothetical protein